MLGPIYAITLIHIAFEIPLIRPQFEWGNNKVTIEKLLGVSHIIMVSIQSSHVCTLGMMIGHITCPRPNKTSIVVGYSNIQGYGNTIWWMHVFGCWIKLHSCWFFTWISCEFIVPSPTPQLCWLLNFERFVNFEQIVCRSFEYIFCKDFVSGSSLTTNCSDIGVQWRQISEVDPNTLTPNFSSNPSLVDGWLPPYINPT